jgi:hypothetical protein
VEGACQSLNQRDVGVGGRWSRNRQTKERAGAGGGVGRGDVASVKKKKFLWCKWQGAIRFRSECREGQHYVIPHV